MQDTNLVIEKGRIGRDPEIRYLADGTALMNFSICVNRSKKVNEVWTDIPNWFDVTVWGKLAERLAHLHKGSLIMVEGYLKEDRWEKDGEKRSKVVIVAEKVHEITYQKAE